ncbi:MAG TPA: ribosome-associated translation inhibitor RaiA [Armatimonadetes bacterium]|nr:ribosome-associated translation inhibitor RaiA [Armatimonadota bacterium]
MQVHVSTAIDEVPADLLEDIESRLDRLGERYRFLQTGYARVDRVRRTHDCEISLHVRHQILRAKERDEDLGLAVDRAFDKIERQLERHKGRLQSHSRTSHPKEDMVPLTQLPAEGDEEYTPPRVVRVKRISMKPMSIDEAILQMELLGHDFYVFGHEEDNTLNVIYRRDSGDIGLIQPE